MKRPVCLTPRGAVRAARAVRPVRGIPGAAILGALGALGAWLAVPTAAAHADAPVITIVDANTEKVHIDRPVVTARSTPLPTVRFRPGDRVTVTAGGCAQTGGSGKTWKRYVDPQGDNSDRLYHGRIKIPLATDDLETFASVMGRENLLNRNAGSPPVVPLQVQALPEGADTSQLFLTVGYDDDEYDDNGYWGHDDGTGDQCKNVGDASIDLLIVHQPAGAPIPKPQLPRAPMDLWWAQEDDNLLPLNPLWGAQVNAQGLPNNTVPDAGKLCNNFHDEDDLLKLGSPPCTTWTPTVDEPSFWSDPAFYTVCQLSGGTSGAVHGHVNWGLATFTGKVVFSDHSLPVPQGTGDDDYDMRLDRADQAAATTNDDRFQPPPPAKSELTGLDLEYDSDETIDFFDTPFWQELHAAVDADSSFAKARDLLGGEDGVTAIATGLVGIDNKHGAHAELHPVLGLMMLVPSRSTSTSDFWVFFSRTRGDEGGCSQDLHAFASTTNMRFLLPLPASRHPRLGAANVRGNVSGGSFNVTPLTDGVLVSINFPPESSSGGQIPSAMAWGELTIQHDAAPPSPRRRVTSAAARPPARAAAPATATPPAAPADRGARPLAPGAAERQATAVEATESDYLGAIRRQLSAAEWQSFLAAYEHPPAPPRSLAQPVVTTRLSVQQHLSEFATPAAAAARAPLASGTAAFQQSPVKVAPRHRTLKPTDVRRMVPSERLPNRAQLLLHQRLAAALVQAVGSERAHAILRPLPGVTPPRPPAGDAWAMPGWQ